LIYVVEDDAQDGPDHVDAHRSIAFVAGTNVKRGAVISAAYTTVNLVRTIVDVLGVDHFNLNEADADPMTDVFATTASSWAFDAIVPDVLRTSSLPLPPATARFRSLAEVLALVGRPQHDAAYWESRTRGFDFTVEDRLDAGQYNRILWQGIMGDNVSYPTTRSGTDLRSHRSLWLALTQATTWIARTVRH